MGQRSKAERQEYERLRREYFACGGKIKRVPMFERGPRQQLRWTGYGRTFRNKQKEDK
jgi:hypothetical protein